ncbi:MAG: hypothetical protein K8S21_08690 [Gemmatimonadetes bacterium]|nr:hypothetical protein [Gemmatimonadota bacterium]
MRVSEARVLTTPRGTPSVPVGTPVRPLRAIRGERAVPLAPRAARLILLNAVVGIAALIRLLPSPWGGMVPVAVLAQAVWYRHGAAAASFGVLAGAGAGAGLGQLLGMDDWRRAMVAMLLLALPAMLAWPARADSERR